MSFFDEPDEDYRAADGRTGGRRGERGSNRTRPAWDAATYGVPDDSRPARRPPPPSGPPSAPYPSDRHPSDGHPPDGYRSDGYRSDGYPPEGHPPDSYPPDPYSRGAYGTDPYPAEPHPADRYGADDYGADRHGADRHGADRHGAHRHAADAYPAAADAYQATYPAGSYPMAPVRGAHTPSTAPSESDADESYAHDSYAHDSYAHDSYAHDSYAHDSYAPESYTSFQAPPPPPLAGESEPPRYVASGLYLDAEDGGSPFPANPGDAADEYPGGWDPEPADPPPGRAGRNLPAAIGVGLGLGAVVLASLFLWRPAFLGVIVAAVVVGVWELVRAIRSSGANPPLLPLIGGGVLMAGLAWWGQADALTFGLVITVLAAMVWRLADGVGGYGRDVTAAALVAVYVPFLGGFAALLASPPADGDLRIIVTLAAVVLSDTGGYIAGVLFGRHPMAPSVSPKKSWEGLAGSLAATALGGAILLLLLFDVAFWWGALFGLAVSASAVVGDLGESMVKRDLRVKDMGTLLPGHGGLMDRLDSILFAVPTAYLVLTVLAPVA